ncbi:MAG: metallopeptidase family protein [Verrucomicrobia bacterium]|nr:metallopeptidase family protein [Verrucomicrobiota bacterium]
MDWPELLRIAEAEVAATISALPEPVRKVIREVPVLIEKHPSPQDVADGIEFDTLGYFDEDPVARIRLWLENIQAYADEEELSFEDEVRTTLLHEIGHVLGWDEDDVEERGLG